MSRGLDTGGDPRPMPMFLSGPKDGMMVQYESPFGQELKVGESKWFYYQFTTPENNLVYGIARYEWDGTNWQFREDRPGTDLDGRGAPMS